MATTGTADLAIEEVTVQGGGDIQPQIAGLGPVTSVFALAGTSAAVAKKLNITGFNFTTATPAVVMLHPRQSDNVDHNFPDQFAVQVIRTTATSILCLIRRLDVAAGWGQNLRLDIWVVDQFHNSV